MRCRLGSLPPRQRERSSARAWRFRRPSSQYSATKLINLGTNRWSVKPEVGVAVPLGRWDLDGYLGFMFYTDNTDFYPGGVARSQDPLLSIQGHVSYTIRPRLWIAARRHVVPRRQRAERRRQPVACVEQHARRRHHLAARTEAVFPQGRVRIGNRRADGNQFPDVLGRVAGAVAESALVRTLRSATAFSTPIQ